MLLALLLVNLWRDTPVVDGLLVACLRLTVFRLGAAWPPPLALGTCPPAPGQVGPGMPPPSPCCRGESGAYKSMCIRSSGRLGTALFVGFARRPIFFHGGAGLLHFCAVRYNKPREYRVECGGKPHPAWDNGRRGAWRTKRGCQNSQIGTLWLTAAACAG